MNANCPYCGKVVKIKKNVRKGIVYDKKCPHCKETFEFHIPIVIERVVRSCYERDVSPETGLETDGYAGVM